MVLGFVGTWLGRNQQTRRCTYGAVAVGAQFKAFATRLPPRRSRMSQIAQVDRARAVVTAQRDADFAGGVVDAQFVGATAFVLFAFDRG